MKINLYHFVILFALLGLAACNNQSADSQAEIAIPVSVVDLKQGASHC